MWRSNCSSKRCSSLPRVSFQFSRQALICFLGVPQVGLSQTLAGFELDMIVVNDSFQQVVQPAVLQLIRDLQVREDVGAPRYGTFALRGLSFSRLGRLHQHWSPAAAAGSRGGSNTSLYSTLH
jgi:hypothetical protein